MQGHNYFLKKIIDEYFFQKLSKEKLKKLFC